MSMELSPQTEQYLANIVAGGLFPSKEAALEAAVAALREKNTAIPFVPDEHMALVEEAIESANAGLTEPITPAFWDDLHQRIREIAARKPSNY